MKLGLYRSCKWLHLFSCQELQSDFSQFWSLTRNPIEFHTLSLKRSKNPPLYPHRLFNLLNYHHRRLNPRPHQ